MPSLPAPIAHFVESRGEPAVVTAIDHLSPRFRRVHLQADTLRGREWVPGAVTVFLVNRSDFRRYTPDAFDANNGAMSILFYCHNADEVGPKPPGEKWVESLSPGSFVVPMGLDATRSFRGRDIDGVVFLCGDASTVGLWQSLIEWFTDRTQVRGIVEVPSADVRLVQSMLPDVSVIAQTTQPGEAILKSIAAVALDAVTHAYLSGHGQTIQRVRILLRQRGLQRNVIYTQPYWATGKTGL